MKSFLLSFINLLITLFVFAQPYGNEWIDYSKTHYKFQSEQEDRFGLMRISYETLISEVDSSGLTLEGSHFKLWSGGEEVPLYVSTDGLMAVGDYLEFYAQPNDGKYDTHLYEDPTHQLNDKMSLFNPKRSYYLVLDETGNHLRYETEENDLADVGTSVPYFWYTSERILSSSYIIRERFRAAPAGWAHYLPEFSPGEGWSSNSIKPIFNPSTGNNVGMDVKLSTEAIYNQDSLDCLVETTLVGNRDYLEIEWDHQIQIAMDGIDYVEDSLIGYELKKFDFSINNLELESIQTNILGLYQNRIKYKALQHNLLDSRFSVVESSITYPRLFDFGEASFFKFDLVISADSYFEIAHFNGGEQAVLYDLTTLKRWLPVKEDSLYLFHILAEENEDNRTFVLANSNDGLSVEWATILEKRNFIDYRLPENQGNYLLVSHASLRTGLIDEVGRYADYRASDPGGNYQVVLADMEELYDQFAYGIEQHPSSIQNFVYFALDHWDKSPQYLNLVGRAFSYIRTRNNTDIQAISLVPSYGFHASDWMLVHRGEWGSLNPQLAVGRIPASSPADVKSYLDKLQEHEAWTVDENCTVFNPPNWSKNVLYLTETHSYAPEIDTDGLPPIQEVLENSASDLSLLASLKDSSNAFLENFVPTPQEDLPTYMNNGIGLINHIGRVNNYHKWLQFDLQSPDFYQNEGKYPFIVSSTNFLGDYQFDSFGLSENEDMMIEYVLADNGGAIGFLAPGGCFFERNADPTTGEVDENYPEGYTYSLNNFHSFLIPFYENLLNENRERSIAENVKTIIQEVYGSRDETFDALLKHYVYTGDPAVRLASVEQRDIRLDNAQLELGTDSVLVSLEVFFTGADFDGPLQIEIERTVEMEVGEFVKLGTYLKEVEVVEGLQTIEFMIPFEPYFAGTNEFSIQLDPNGLVTERCKQNNFASLLEYWDSLPEEEQFVFSGKVFLEGPYDENSEMNTALNELIPLEQPFGMAPYFYNGQEQLNENEPLTNLVDWVLVEIRLGSPNLSGIRGTFPIQRVAALLWNDGSISSTDMTSTDMNSIRFAPLSNEEEFYVCIRHRNHLDVLSALPVESNSLFDFSLDVNQAWGGAQMKMSTDSVALMYAADFNEDAIIQISDYDLWFLQPAVLDVYGSTDANLDGVIQVSDYDLWFLNRAKVGSVEVKH